MYAAATSKLAGYILKMVSYPHLGLSWIKVQSDLSPAVTQCSGERFDTSG